MKYLIIYFLLISKIIAQDISIGAGVYTLTQPYENVKNVVIPTPVVFFDNSLFYIRWSRAGIYFFGEENKDYSWGFSLTTQPRVYGYDSSDINGMKTKKNTWESGLAFSAKSNNSYIEIMALTDLFDRYDSWVLKTEVGHLFRVDKFTIIPSIIAVYQSSDFINYYYGVSQEESISSKYNPYKANKGLQIGLQSYINYPINDEFSALVSIRADRLSNEATDSPIVTKKYIYSGLISVLYTFNY